jgi:hypothetical protein
VRREGKKKMKERKEGKEGNMPPPLHGKKEGRKEGRKERNE